MRQKLFTPEQKEFILNERRKGRTYEALALLFNSRWPDRSSSAYVIASVVNRAMDSEESRVPLITLSGPVWSVPGHCQHVSNVA